MNMSLRNLLPTIAGAFLSLNAARAGQPKVGDTFPNLSEYSLEGNLPDLKGKIVVVDFWASWCGPCKEAFPALKELHQKYREKGLVIVAVSVDTDRIDMDKFVAKQKPPFTIVRDQTTKLATQLDLGSIPTTFILDRAGKIREVHNGFYSNKTPKEYNAAIEQLLKN